MTNGLLEMRASERSNISIWATLKRSQSTVKARISILRQRGQDEPPSDASPEIKRVPGMRKIDFLNLLMRLGQNFLSLQVDNAELRLDVIEHVRLQ
jgi:hypothetical protein